MESNGLIGLALLKDPETESPVGSELHSVGTVAKIVKRINLPDGGMNIFISTLKTL